MNDLNLEQAAHIVQLALTPVFLLSAVATLLNVFATRLGRIADQTDAVSGTPKGETGRDPRLRLLQWRSRALDVAVVMAALAGAMTCCAVLVLFLGQVRGSSAASLLFLFFGSAIVLTICALVAFVTEMLLAARGIRRLVERSVGERRTSARTPTPR